MMEQEEQGAHCADNCPAAIDITAIHSPTSSDGQTSGYGSADDEHLCSPGLPSSRTGRGSKPLQTFSESGLLGDMDFMNGFLVSGVPRSQNEKVCTTSDALRVQVSGTTVDQVAASMVSPSQVSPASAFSPSRNTGFSMNDNFDNGDIEMYDTSSGIDGNSTNITVTLPSNVNLQGNDTKSLLLSILKNADKSELLKLNTQLTNALATIQAQGGNSGQPNIHISIESQPKSRGYSSVSGPVPCTASSAKNNELSNKTLTSNVEGAESFFSMSPGGETLMDTCDIPLVHPTRTSTADNSSATVLSSGASDITNASSVNQKMNDTMAAIFSDLDSSQFPEYNDVFNLTSNTESDLTEQLLNDVNLGRSVATGAQSSATPCSQSYTSIQASDSVPMATITPLTCPSKMQTPNARNHTHKSVVRPTVHVKQSNINNITSTNSQKQQQQHHQIDLAAAKRGLDDHSYFCSKSPSRNSNGHVKFAPEGKAQKRPQGSVLEHFLTTKDPINPMRGSDYVAHGLSKLHLEESQGLKPNLLKQLLTEDVGRKDCVQRLEASSSSLSASNSTQVRKPATVSSSSSNSANTTNVTSGSNTNTAVSMSSGATAIPGPLESELGFGEPGLAELDMLGTTTDMDSLWNEECKPEEEVGLFGFCT